MENHLVEGSYMWQMAGGSFNPHQKVPNGSGGTSADFGGFGYTTENVNSPEQTKAFKDLIAYLTSPQYFKGIDFTEFISNKGGPGDKEKSQQKVTLSGKSKNFTGKFSISYDYEVKDGKTIVSDIKMHTNLNDKWSPLDSWSENVNGSMEEEPIYTVRGNYIFFETYGTLKLLDFSFSKNGISGGFSIFEFPYKFTGYVNVNDPSNSNVNIKAIKP
jgi:hypothetical protein